MVVIENMMLTSRSVAKHLAYPKLQQVGSDYTPSSVIAWITWTFLLFVDFAASSYISSQVRDFVLAALAEPDE